MERWQSPQSVSGGLNDAITQLERLLASDSLGADTKSQIQELMQNCHQIAQTLEDQQIPYEQRQELAGAGRQVLEALVQNQLFIP